MIVLVLFLWFLSISSKSTILRVTALDTLQHVNGFTEGSVRLNCPTSTPSVEWEYKYVGAIDPSTIYKDGGFQHPYPNGDQYQLDTSQGGFDLINTDVQLEDAGEYICIDGNGRRTGFNLTVTATRKLRVGPFDTISVVGQNATMTCSTSYNGSSVWWQHKRVKGISYNDVYLSFIGFQGEYAAWGRHSIISNSLTGQYNLHIENVQFDDAGIYRCIDRDGLGLRESGELVVVGAPQCSSDIPTDGVIVDNICGMKPDVVQMFCYTFFRGNQHPNISWSSGISSGHEIYTSSIDGSVISTLRVQASHNVNWVDLVCQTHLKGTVAHSCRPNPKIPAISLTVVLNETRTYKYHNCSLSVGPERCNYSWTEYINDEEAAVKAEIEYQGPLMNLTDAKEYRCIAECNIRGVHCTFSMDFHDHGKQPWINHGMTAGVILWILFLLALILSVIGLALHAKCTYKIATDEETKTTLLNNQIMPPSCSVTIRNKLSSCVTNVTICYAESVKRKGILYKFDWRSVDVELGRFVQWERFVKVDTISNGEKCVSAEEIYFGKNRGYWQVYFTFDGKKYKIKRNNAEVGLGWRDRDKAVLIDILNKDTKIYVDFTVPSNSETHSVLAVEGSPCERGVLVEIQNELPDEISNIRLIYEERLGHISIWQHTLSKFENVPGFNKNLKSSERLRFGCHISCWQLLFTYKDRCYRLSKNHVIYNLGWMDNGKTLTILIYDENKLKIAFHVSGKKKPKLYFPEPVRSITTKERNFDVEKLRTHISSQSAFDSFKRFRDISIAKSREIHNLLRNVNQTDGVENSSGNLLFQIPKIESKRIVAEDYNLAFFENCNEKDVLGLLEDLKLTFKNGQILVEELKDQFNQIKMLQDDVMATVDLPAFSKRFLRFGGITSQCLNLVGYSSYGLITKIGADQERGIQTSRLADALENEVSLLTTSELSKESCTKALKIEFEKYEILVLDSQRMLRATAEHFLRNKQGVSITKIVFDVAGLIAGLMLLFVFILNSYVFLFPPNIFRGLIISGILIGVIGGVGNLISVIVEVVKKKTIILQFMKDSESVEHSLLDVVTNMDELSKELIEPVTNRPRRNVSQAGASDHLSMSAPIGLNRVIKLAVTAMIGMVGVRGLGSGLSLRGGMSGGFVKLTEVGGLSVARNVLEIVTTGIGVLFDVLFLISSILSLRSAPNLGYKFMILAEELETELKKQRIEIGNRCNSSPDGVEEENNLFA